MPLAPGDKLGSYEILSPLGAGGMGEVYRARDAKLNRDVAIKVLPPALANDADYLVRFQREAQALAALNHPNIAAIYGLENNAIVMELVEGETLSRPIPVKDLLPIARQIAEALEAAHDKGIIHRDLKPGNIKLTPEGVVKVLDFGLAKSVERSNESSPNSPTLTMRATEAGLILGTAGYMSPEQAAGKPVDRRADIWSFGVVLYELLTGTRLFDGETVSHTLADVLRADIDLSKIPDGPVRELIRRCLDRNLKNRLSHIAEARYIIDNYAAAPVAKPVAGPAIATRWLWAACGVLAACLIAIAALYFTQKPAEHPLVRLQFPLPEKVVFGKGQGLAISPDGKRVVFGAKGGDGRIQLWIRPLESLTAQPLPGSEGGESPFWSPDSRNIGFFTRNDLRRIEASGGPPQVLCKLNGVGTGGSWSRGGVIVFGTNTTALFQVPQSGGAATPLTTLDSARHEIRHTRPWLLPDGKRMLFLAVSSNADLSGYDLISLDSKDRKRIVATSTGAAYVPPASGTKNGHLLFLRGGTLMAQMADPGTLNLVGDPARIAEDVGSYLSLSHFSVSETGVLVFHTGNGGLRRILWFDREGKEVGTIGSGTPDLNAIALSPDGQGVAVTHSGYVTANRDIWLIDTKLGIPSRFTFDAAVDNSPVWSPSGDRIAFMSLRNGPANLFRKDTTGSGSEELLLASSSNKYPVDWSADGKYLLYTDDAKGNSDLWLLPDPGGAAGNGKPRPFLTTPFNERQGRFSPSVTGGPSWIAYTSDESGKVEVFVQSVTESGAAGGGKFQLSVDGGSGPRWRADGKELYYLAPNRRLMAVDVKLAPHFEHGQPRLLFPSRTTASGNEGQNYSPSADGKRFLMLTEDESDAAVPFTVVLNWATGLSGN